MSKADALSRVVDSIARKLVGPAANQAYSEAIRELGLGMDTHTGKPRRPTLSQDEISAAFVAKLRTDAATHLPTVQIRTRWLAGGDWSEQRDILLAGGWSPEEAEYIVAGLSSAANTIDATAQERAA